MSLSVLLNSYAKFSLVQPVELHQRSALKKTMENDLSLKQYRQRQKNGLKKVKSIKLYQFEHS